MRIILVTPAPPKSRAGNRATAARWAAILTSFGHRVEITTGFSGQNADLMIALHAWRSASSIQQFAEAFPRRPLIVAITGTDAYRFIHTHPDITLQSIRLASHLVGLHDLISNTLPPDARHKMHVIYQSARPIAKRQPYKRYFHISVMGHLREEKDPLRPALAARHLPDSSRIKVHQYGKAHSDEWAKLARMEMEANPRYTWHDEIAHHRIRQIYQRTNLLVLPSRMEGGANVISEAVVAGIPVIASDIEGSLGLLGEDYPGYYPVENEQALADLMLKAETDNSFHEKLEQACIAKQPLFTPENESRGWRNLLSQL
ncbi:selenoneine biosynthesis selenosugar synthase SenB [Thiohalophilus thiocyanatoxydans]|uniref:Putative glycosyltransferase (TIGR04348 family) n=1 Tax=Thiohalophilus thiocyanatoxydans TaxID=381308 RepID=A0A4R8IJP0_9GAMM|nr:selenoneine biosynthesis selenosugar synthase SenB [Thiohalophilus thiocyanatoxydans]TDY00952.1 putative glycosyltransferase (TIGR04348 family) [Thiohalophilus thiocyanatoxydans]